MAADPVPSDPWLFLAARAVDADRTELDHIAQMLQELTFEGAEDDLEAFEAAWLPVLPTMVERARAADEVELARALRHVADHLAAIHPHPGVRILMDHAWASQLWLRDELPEVGSEVLEFDEGEVLYWYGDVGINAFGPVVCVDAPAGYVQIPWQDALTACDEVCVTSTRVRFLANFRELADIPLEDVEIIVVDDATVLVRVSEGEAILQASLPMTFRAVVVRAQEAAGHPQLDFHAHVAELFQQVWDEMQAPPGVDDAGA